MYFSSMLFISVFLPLVFLIYWASPIKLRNIVLLIASILFYASAEPKYLLILFCVILTTYIGTIVMSKVKNKKLAFIMTLLATLIFLLYFKYFDYIILAFESLFGAEPHNLSNLLPLGISFYTFQAISYVCDVYKGESKLQKSFFDLALYISFFPQLVAGPIIKYNDIEQQLETRETNIDNVAKGIRRFIVGLAKKVLLADTIGVITVKVFEQNPDAITTPMAWIGAFGHTLQVFYDFSGYSDMAIGLGLIFGFKFMENFDYPFFYSKSMGEYWRRWHISLGVWFKNYIYIPLGGSRCSKLKHYRNLAIVFLLMGFWHGVSLKFIFFGIYHGFLVITEKILGIVKETQNLFLNSLKHIYALLFIIIGGVIIRSKDLGQAFNLIQTMFGCGGNKDPMFPLEYYILGKWEMIIIAVAFLCCTPIFRNFQRKFEGNVIVESLTDVYLLLLFILTLSEIALTSYNPFIYFQY